MTPAWGTVCYKQQESDRKECAESCSSQNSPPSPTSHFPNRSPRHRPGVCCFCSTLLFLRILFRTVHAESMQQTFFLEACCLSLSTLLANLKSEVHLVGPNSFLFDILPLRILAAFLTDSTSTALTQNLSKLSDLRKWTLHLCTPTCSGSI